MKLDLCPSDPIDLYVYIPVVYGDIYVKWAIKWVIMYNTLRCLLLWAEDELHIFSVSPDLFLVIANLLSKTFPEGKL